MTGIEITVFRKLGGALSKHISLTRAGKINADGSECRMSSGTARRIKLNGAASLADLIEAMPSDEALTLGRLRPGLPDKVRVIPKRELDEATPSDIRSGRYRAFAWPRDRWRRRCSCS
jgi:hypothetical protein